MCGHPTDFQVVILTKLYVADKHPDLSCVCLCNHTGFQKHPLIFCFRHPDTTFALNHLSHISRLLSHRLCVPAPRAMLRKSYARTALCVHVPTQCGRSCRKEAGLGPADRTHTHTDTHIHTGQR